MKFAVLAIGCLVVSAAVFAESTKRELWSWKDSDGVVHYSDRPVPGAKRIEIATMTPESAPPPAPPVTTPSGAPKAAAPVDQYEVLEIYAPEDGESFFGLESQVTVRVRSDPELIPGHQLRVFIDSQPVEKDPTAYVVTLGPFERGAHSVTAQIVDENGKPLALSESRTFFIKQPGLNKSENVGPALKPKPPPPKPKPTAPKAGP
jgi:hypothetical protein